MERYSRQNRSDAASTHKMYRGNRFICLSSGRLSQLRTYDRGGIMPRGDKSSYSSKQKRMAEHIEEGVKKRGGSEKQAARIGWATVNKYTGGAKKKSGGSSTRKSSSSKSRSSRNSSKRTGPAKTSGSTHKKLARAGRKGAAAAGRNITRESSKSKSHTSRSKSHSKGSKSHTKTSGSTHRKLSAAGKKGAAARNRKRHRR